MDRPPHQQQQLPDQPPREYVQDSSAFLSAVAAAAAGEGGSGRIETLRPWDILCGRQRRSYFHVGNRRFRITISLNYRRYMLATSRKEKAVVARSVADLLQNDVGARFVREAEEGGYYVELSANEIREKISHALRDMAASHRQQEREREEQRSRKRRRKDDTTGN